MQLEWWCAFNMAYNTCTDLLWVQWVVYMYMGGGGEGGVAVFLFIFSNYLKT